MTIQMSAIELQYLNSNRLLIDKCVCLEHFCGNLSIIYLLACAQPLCRRNITLLRRGSQACHAFLPTNLCSVRREERVTSLRTSAWEARETLEDLFFLQLFLKGSVALQTSFLALLS